MSAVKPLLSVLVPAHNVENYVSACISSLLVQTYSNFEILICDDGSTDDTGRIIGSFQDKRLSVFKNESNIGKNKTCSFLLEKAKGDFITVHDADDISSSLRFQHQIDFLIRNREYGMCGTNFVSFINNGKVVSKSNLNTADQRIRELIKDESQFHGPTVVIRRNVIPSAGGLYRYFTHAEDIDFTMRVTEKFKVANLPEHLYFYRHHQSSLTNHVNGYSVERLAKLRLVYYLAEERRSNNGIDSLMRGDSAFIEQLVDKFKEEFRHDPDIPLRRGVFRLLHMRMYKNAVLLSLKTMLRNPAALNIKCFLYAAFHAAKGVVELLGHESLDQRFLKNAK